MKTNPNDPIDWSQVQLLSADKSGIKECRMGGLTKREYFAAKAMQGMLSDTENSGDIELIIRDSVRLADALIEDLNKEETK